MQIGGGVVGVLYKLSEWMVRLAYLNLLWIGFSIAGLIVFGFLPATAAMFAIIRRWKMGEFELSVFKSFFDYYRSDFFKINLLGLMLILFGVTLYVNMQFIQISSTAQLAFLNVPLLVLAFFYCLTLLYIIPVYVHYEFNLLQVIKNSFLMMVLNPLTTLFMVTGCLLMYILIGLVLGLLPFFSGSGLAFVIMYFALRAFNRIEEKRTRIAEIKAN